MWTNCMYFAKIKIPCKPNDYRRLWCPEQALNRIYIGSYQKLSIV